MGGRDGDGSPGRFRHLVEPFRAFLRDVSLEDRRVSVPRGHTVIGRSYGSNNAELGWGHPAYQKAIEAFRKVCVQVSAEAVGKTLRSSVVDLFERAAVREDADPEIEAHLDSILPTIEEELGAAAIQAEAVKIAHLLESQVRLYRMFVPLEGVELTKLEIGDVILYDRHHGPLNEILAEMANMRAKPHRDVAHAFDQIPCYATVEVEGDPEYARQDAFGRVEDAVCILNLFLAYCRDRARLYRRIGTAGYETGRWEQFVFGITRLVSDDADQSRLGWNVKEYATPKRRHRVDALDVREWKTHGFDEVVTAFFELRDQGPKTVAARVRRSVTWNTKAVNAETPGEQCIALATALETLLIGDEGSGLYANWGSITQRLADRVAFLLGHDCQDRIDWATKAKRVYRLRGKVVHSGETVSQENVDVLEHIVYRAILAFACHGFSSWDEFLDWEATQRYTASSE